MGLGEAAGRVNCFFSVGSLFLKRNKSEDQKKKEEECEVTNLGISWHLLTRELRSMSWGA